MQNEKFFNYKHKRKDFTFEFTLVDHSFFSLLVQLVFLYFLCVKTVTKKKNEVNQCIYLMTVEQAGTGIL